MDGQATQQALSDTEMVILDAAVMDLKHNLDDLAAEANETGQVDDDIAEDILTGLTTVAHLL